MSYSSLYKVYKTTATSFAEFSNGHGSGPPVWNLVWSKYMGHTGEMYPYDQDERTRAMWGMYRNMSIPKHVRFGLLWTCDHVCIEPDFIAEASGLCEKLYKELDEWDEWGSERVNHWRRFGEALAEVRADKRCLGIGLGCTSVSDPWEDYAYMRGGPGICPLFDELPDALLKALEES